MKILQCGLQIVLSAMKNSMIIALLIAVCTMLVVAIPSKGLVGVTPFINIPIQECNSLYVQSYPDKIAFGRDYRQYPHILPSSKLFAIPFGVDPKKSIDTKLSATLQSRRQQSYDPSNGGRLNIEPSEDNLISLPNNREISLSHKILNEMKYAPWQKSKEMMKAKLQGHVIATNQQITIREPISIQKQSIPGKMESTSPSVIAMRSQAR